MRGATTAGQRFTGFYCIFQSTPPVWGRPAAPSFRPLPQIYFNLRPPCGGRLASFADGSEDSVFQSTPPMRGATAKTAKISSCFHNKIGNSFKIPLLTPIQLKKQGSILTENIAKCGAKRWRFPVCLCSAPKASTHPVGHRISLLPNAQSCSHSGFLSNKNVDCPFPGP